MHVDGLPSQNSLEPDIADIFTVFVGFEAS